VLASGSLTVVGGPLQLYFVPWLRPLVTPLRPLVTPLTTRECVLTRFLKALFQRTSMLSQSLKLQQCLHEQHEKISFSST